MLCSAQGLYQIKPQLPYVPGMDAAGVVVGKGKNKATAGDTLPV